MCTRYQQHLQTPFDSAFNRTADIWDMYSEAPLNIFGSN